MPPKTISLGLRGPIEKGNNRPLVEQAFPQREKVLAYEGVYPRIRKGARREEALRGQFLFQDDRRGAPVFV
jgi:hypothetical protein